MNCSSAAMRDASYRSRARSTGRASTTAMLCIKRAPTPTSDQTYGTMRGQYRDAGIDIADLDEGHPNEQGTRHANPDADRQPSDDARADAEPISKSAIFAGTRSPSSTPISVRAIWSASPPGQSHSHAGGRNDLSRRAMGTALALAPGTSGRAAQRIGCDHRLRSVRPRPAIVHAPARLLRSPVVPNGGVVASRRAAARGPR